MGREIVQIGNIRLKRSNISAFGVSTGRRVVGLEIGFWRLVLAHLAAGNKSPTGEYRYLFVTTYQRDNYQFPEDEIDIDAVLADLEKGA